MDSKTERLKIYCRLCYRILEGNVVISKCDCKTNYHLECAKEIKNKIKRCPKFPKCNSNNFEYEDNTYFGRQMNQEFEVTCKWCKITFETKEKYNKHIDDCPKRKKICKYCFSKFWEDEKLSEHVWNAHAFNVVEDSQKKPEE